MTTRAPDRIPLEFRLALGASKRFAVFDGTAILNLCPGDPWVSEDMGGSLVSVRVRDSLDPQFEMRIGASPRAPREVYRTGFGVRLGWNLEIEVATSRLGFLPPDAVPQPEVNDGSLFHLASLLGLTATTADALTAAYPPHLWLCPNYQHFAEQWIPVQVDPDNAGIGSLEFTEGKQTQSRTLTARLVSRQHYKKVLPQYFPSLKVTELDVKVVALPAFAPGVADQYGAQLTLSAALPSYLDLQDWLLLNLGNTRYGWKLVKIESIDNEPSRTLLTVSSALPIETAYLIPPQAPIAVRGVRQRDEVYLPTYCLYPFVGAPPVNGQMSLPNAYLLGDPYDFCGGAPDVIEPLPPPIIPTCDTGFDVSQATDVQYFSGGTFNWVKPAWAVAGRKVLVKMIGAGGPGAGAQAVFGVTATGAGGGGGGGFACGVFDAGDLPDLVPVKAPDGQPGGTGGGASGTVTPTEGVDGEAAEFGNPGNPYYLKADGGKHGLTNGAGGEGAGATPSHVSGTGNNGGGGGSGDGTSGSGGGADRGAPGGGGGGDISDSGGQTGGQGGLPHSPTAGGGVPGGAGGGVGLLNGGDGLPGLSGDIDTPGGGGSGGGGVSPSTTGPPWKGGTGGAGGFPGGGGGGGGGMGNSACLGGDGGPSGGALVVAWTF